MRKLGHAVDELKHVKQVRTCHKMKNIKKWTLSHRDFFGMIIQKQNLGNRQL